MKNKILAIILIYFASRSNIISQLLLKGAITVSQLEGRGIDILSSYQDKLLTGVSGSCELFIYNLNGEYISNITINDNDTIGDATWTHLGNIVYVTQHSNKAVLIEDSGKIIVETEMRNPQNLSISVDGTVCLADWQTGVYQSTNGGVTWELVYRSPDEWHCWQVLKVTKDNSYDYWTIEANSYTNRLRVYSLEKSSGNLTSRDINLLTSKIELLRSSLSYDNNYDVILSDHFNKTIYKLSVNSEYHKQLFSSKFEPYSLSMNKQSNQMFIGLYLGEVGVGIFI